MRVKIDGSQARQGAPANPQTDAERLVKEFQRAGSTDDAMIHAAGKNMVWFAVCGAVLPQSPENAMTLVFRCADQSLLALEISPGQGIAFVALEKPPVN